MEDLSRRADWRALLHGEETLRGWRSGLRDDPDFFLSPQGWKDPAAELNATVRAFKQPVDPADPDAHAQCRYPARWSWWQSTPEFRAGEYPAAACERFAFWRDRLQAQGVSLVFAGYFMGNPASMYGHTFLRLRRHADAQDDPQPLLDYTINYAANAPDRNPLLYAWRGLAGGYRGGYTSVPYYVKRQEYSRIDSRDIWEYPLDLSTAETAQLVRHAWELGHASPRYYFFNRNCSYQLLPLLRAARPSLDWRSRFQWKTIPADTVRFLRESGAAQPGFRRASFQAEMLARRSRLGPAERRWAEDMARHRRLPEGPAPALVLESAHDLFRFKAGNGGELSAADAAFEHRLLTARSVAASSGSVAVPALEPALPPEGGHATSRLWLARGLSTAEDFLEAAWRPALHEIDDPSAGYVARSQLEFFDLRARHLLRRNRFYLHEANLVDIKSMPAWDSWVRKPAWTLRTGWATALETSGAAPEKAGYYELNVGAGIGGRWLYATPVVNAGWGNVFEHNGRVGGGAAGGLLLEPTARWRMRAEAEILRWAIDGRTPERVRLEAAVSWSAAHWADVRVIARRLNQTKELTAGAAFYF